MNRDELIQQLMGTFLEELEQLLGSMRLDLLALAQTSPPPDQQQRLELCHSLYRSVHSLKGAARSVDQDLISSACQLLEEILPGPRRDPGTVHEHEIDTAAALLPGAVEAFVDAGRRLGLGESLEGAGGSAGEAPIARLVRQLETRSPPRVRNPGRSIPPAASAAPAGSTKAAPRAGAAGRHILVAEDSITMQALGKTLLEAAGYQVHTATNGLDAWRILGERGADLVVSDVEMPGMDGLALTARIRSSERFRALPVILFTSLDRPEDRQRGLEAGANAYLIKGAPAGEDLAGEDLAGEDLVDVVERLLVDHLP